MKTILVLICLVLASVQLAEAQQSKVPRIGFLSQAEVAKPFLERFLTGLSDLNYVDGKTIIIEYRNAKGDPDLLPTLASDLVSRKVDLIVVVGGEASLAAKNATRTIPIVMTVASDPVRSGLVESLARPGGNITGLSAVGPESGGKRLELLKEIVPRLSIVAVLAYTLNPAYKLQLREVEDAAPTLNLELKLLEVQEPNDFGSAFVAAKQGRVGAVNVLTSAFIAAHRKNIIRTAEISRLPVIYPSISFVEAGGLMSYGLSVIENYRRAATYVDKILKGAKPADLPVEQPTTFELAINLKTAKQIGLTIPPNLLARADRVIK